MDTNFVLSICSGVIAGLVVGLMSYKLFFNNPYEFSRSLDQAVRPDFYAYLGGDGSEHSGKRMRFGFLFSVSLAFGVIVSLVTYYFIL